MDYKSKQTVFGMLTFFKSCCSCGSLDYSCKKWFYFIEDPLTKVKKVVVFFPKHKWLMYNTFDSTEPMSKMCKKQTFKRLSYKFRENESFFESPEIFIKSLVNETRKDNIFASQRCCTNYDVLVDDLYKMILNNDETKFEYMGENISGYKATEEKHGFVFKAITKTERKNEANRKRKLGSPKNTSKAVEMESQTSATESEKEVEEEVEETVEEAPVQLRKIDKIEDITPDDWVTFDKVLMDEFINDEIGVDGAPISVTIDEEEEETEEEANARKTYWKDLDEIFEPEEIQKVKRQKTEDATSLDKTIDEFIARIFSR